MSAAPSLAQPSQQNAERIAIVAEGRSFTYRELLSASAAAATTYLAGGRDLAEARVALLVPPGFDLVAALWGIWRAGGIAVPLCLQHPPPEWEYVLYDTGASAIVVDPDFAERIRPLAEARSMRVLSRASGVASAPGVWEETVYVSRRWAARET